MPNKSGYKHVTHSGFKKPAVFKSQFGLSFNFDVII